MKLSPLTDAEQDAYEALAVSILSAANGPTSTGEETSTLLLRVGVDKALLPDEVAIVLVRHGDPENDTLSAWPVAMVITPEVFDALITPSEAGQEGDQ